MNLVLKRLDDLEMQSKQLKTEIDYLDFELNNAENKIVNSDIIRENFKVLRDVDDQLTLNEKYDLMHLLIKKIVHYEDAKANDEGKKKGRIRMELWELPPIDPSKKNSANGFAESNGRRPFIDDFRTWLIQKRLKQFHHRSDFHTRFFSSQLDRRHILATL